MDRWCHGGTLNSEMAVEDRATMEGEEEAVMVEVTTDIQAEGDRGDEEVRVEGDRHHGAQGQV